MKQRITGEEMRMASQTGGRVKASVAIRPEQGAAVTGFLFVALRKIYIYIKRLVVQCW